jgi:hypothetical protein
MSDFATRSSAAIAAQISADAERAQQASKQVKLLEDDILDLRAENQELARQVSRSGSR